MNSIWEGSGNVQCLDVLRALQKEPAVREALFSELQSAVGLHPLYDSNLAWLHQMFGDVNNLEARSRLVVERAALAIQAALLLKSGNADVADMFCRARLGTECGFAFGSLDSNAPLSTLIDRAMPRL